MKQLTIIIVMLVASITVSAQSYKFEHDLYKHYPVTEQDLNYLQQQVDSMRNRVDSLLTVMNPFVTSMDLQNVSYSDYSKADLETRFTAYANLINAHRGDQLYRTYTGVVRRHMKLDRQLGRAESLCTDLVTAKTILNDEIKRDTTVAGPASGIYTTKWTEPINEDDVITVTAPYKTVQGFRVYDGICKLRRTKKQYPNATGTHFKPVTYDVTITLTVDDGMVKSEQYSGSMYFWSPNYKIRNSVNGSHHQKQVSVDKARPVSEAKPVKTYEDFGYAGQYAKDMLHLLQTESFTVSDENAFIQSYLSTAGNLRDKLVQQFQKRYRTYKSSILIDFSEIRPAN